MKIAVTTPTGNIGTAVTAHLLDAGADVVLLVRNPAKVEHFTNRGARAVQGDMSDADYLTRATVGVDAILWVTPPNLKTHDLRAFQNLLAHAGAKAIRANRIPRVVNISSVGAHLGWGTGPINGLHDVEGALNDAVENITHLRPGFFYENYFWQLDSIRNASAIFMPVSGHRHMPMIATCDIARVAADRLLDSTWTGRGIHGLLGPADMSFNEAAEQISQGIGKTVRHVKIPEIEMRRNLLHAGISENVIENILEMYSGLEAGTWRPAEERTHLTTTPTTLVEFAGTALAAMLREPVGSAK